MNFICRRDFKPIGGFSKGKYVFAMIVDAIDTLSKADIFRQNDGS